MDNKKVFRAAYLMKGDLPKEKRIYASTLEEALVEAESRAPASAISAEVFAQVPVGSIDLSRTGKCAA